METVYRFGLETKLFIFQIINFFIISMIIRKFLYSSLKKTLDERQRKIQQSIDKINNANSILKNAFIEKEKILADARETANKIIDNAKFSIIETENKMMLDLNNKALIIINNAKEMAKKEFETSNKKIIKMALIMSKDILSRVLCDFFNESDKNKLMAYAINKINERITN
ncbi:MAG: hypothetical protein LBL53_01220 [Endomicrobium sp.]|jgi:F-type H+-transporting ATPase subunit b|nr:hypothetical protein [Endomicrobium sp.]